MNKPLFWENLIKLFPEWEQGFDYSLNYGNLTISLDDRGDWAMTMFMRSERIAARIDPFRPKSICAAKAAASRYFDEDVSRKFRLYPYEKQ